jgi:hypothetical protein
MPGSPGTRVGVRPCTSPEKDRAARARRASLLDRPAHELEAPAHVLQDTSLEHAPLDAHGVFVEEEPIGIPEVGPFRILRVREQDDELERPIDISIM